MDPDPVQNINADPDLSDSGCKLNADNTDPDPESRPPCNNVLVIICTKKSTFCPLYGKGGTTCFYLRKKQREKILKFV
jgi:hypothetical protein